MTVFTSPLRRALRPALAVASLLTLSGCGFHGIQEMALPGTTGTGSHALKIRVDLPDVSTLTPNGQVKVNDVNVGTVTRLRVVGWHAQADVSLEPDVDLPANAVAAVGVDSLLGAGYLQLSAPSNPRGHLTSGNTISLARSSAYPTTEQVLSAASFVLNGGGLEQIATITTELNRALGGNHGAIRALLPRLDSFIGQLDGQKDQIIAAIDDIDRLATRLSGRREVIDGALKTFPSAIATLSKQEQALRNALTSIGSLNDSATQVIDASRADLVENLTQLRPTLEALAASGKALTHSLGYALTFPFPPATVPNACRGDYCNLFLTIDLTTDSLANLVPAGGNANTPSSGGSLGGTLGGVLSGTGSLLGGALGDGQGLLGPVGGTVNNLLGQTIPNLTNGLLGSMRAQPTHRDPKGAN